jgi:tetratricopeptide (TPR) repeat protein
MSNICRPSIVVLAALSVLSGACGSQERSEPPPASVPAAPPRPADRGALQTVSLPDLSKLDAPVQKQLRDGYQQLTAKMMTPGISDVDLGFAYGEMGKLLMAAEFRDAAVPAFLDAEMLTPGERRWPYYLGHLYKLQGDPRRSTEAFERALRLKPDDLATLVWLGSAYLDQGRPADAGQLFSRAYSIAPRSVPVLFGMGRTALAKQEYMRAVEYLEQALDIDPKAVVIHYPLAMAYRAMGNLQKAEAHLRLRGPGEIRPPDPLMQELDLLLESAVAYEVRGAAALDESNWAAAAEYFRKGVELAPNEPSLRHKLGTALAMSGDPRAVEQFEEVTRRWPKFAKAQYSLGLVLASSGRLREAADHFSAAVKSDPSYSEARLQLAETLRATGRYQESLAQYEDTITLNPRLPEARLGYAMSLAALQRFDDARRQLAEGARIFPDRREFAEALNSLASAGSSR